MTPSPAPMTPERWRAVDAVMQAALERDAPDRPAFLDRACAGDAALRHEVESLLAVAAADSFLEHPAAALLAAAPEATTGAGLPLRSPPMLRLAAALEDRYAVERELGQGGMATVYLARDLRHRRPVAMKVLHPQLSDALGPERFLREIELTASLQHPHILPLFDSGAVGGLLYYVMPYVEGETVRARLLRDGPLPVDEAVRLAREVADALAYAHGRGVIHRDVKPENILLQGGHGGAQHALVADFGIALAVEQAGGARMTRTGVSLGTPQYMAPEQATGDRGVDARVDVYALGAVLYEMLAGDSPFAATSVHAVVTRVLTEAPRPLAAERPGVPPNVAAAVRTALEKLPGDRFAGAAEFAAALVDPTYARADTPPSVAAPAAPTPRRLSPRTTALLAGGALLGTAALGWMVGATRGRPFASGADVAAAQGPVRFALAPDTGFVRFGAQAISPDGRTVVFAAERAYGARLYARRLDELVARPIKGTEGGDHPFFSPDGTSIGFHADGALRTIALAGGAPAIVAGTGSQGGFAGGAWGEDGTIVFATRDRGALFRIPVGGGAPSSLGGGGDGPALRQPHLLPGGRAILLTAAGDGDGGEVAVLVLATGELRRFGDGQGARYAAGQIVYADEDGALYRRPFDLARLEPTGAAERIGEGADAVTVARSERIPAFDVSAAGALVYQVGFPSAGGNAREAVRLVLTDRAGRELAELPARVPWTPRFSPEGRRVAYGAFAPGRGSSDVWVTDLRTSTTQRITNDADDSNDPQWSPDGRSLAYSANGAGGKDVVVQALDGTPARRYARDGVQWPSDWPRGGRGLLFSDGGRQGREDLWVQPLDGGAAHPFLETPAAELGARVSPDGRWVVYQSDEGGRTGVYVQSYPEPGRRVRISITGGVNPVWAGDGRQIYYWNEGQLIAAQVAPAGDTLAVRDRTPLFRAAYYDNVHPNYDVSPDGTRFVVVTGGQRVGRVVVGLNLLGGK